MEKSHNKIGEKNMRAFAPSFKMGESDMIYFIPEDEIQEALNFFRRIPIYGVMIKEINRASIVPGKQEEYGEPYDLEAKIKRFR